MIFKYPYKGAWNTHKKWKKNKWIFREPFGVFHFISEQLKIYSVLMNVHNFLNTSFSDNLIFQKLKMSLKMDCNYQSFEIVKNVDRLEIVKFIRIESELLKLQELLSMLFEIFKN